MKCLTFGSLILLFAAANFAFAEDEQTVVQRPHRPVPARGAVQPRQYNSAARLQRPLNVSPQSSFRAQPQFHRPQGINTIRGLQNSQRQITPNPAAGNSQVGINGSTNADRYRDWQNRRNWNGNTDNNSLGNRTGRNTDSSVSNSDWQNRSGHEGNNWERNRWSNNHNWDRNRRSRTWWRSHYTRFALFGGGYYYWNSGYWYPAYGYDPYFTSYSYDAPIYAYNDQDPGQVIANVQVELQRRGYEPGGVDGTYGPATRRALLDYQRDNGLPVTGEIDDSTLDSLGLR